MLQAIFPVPAKDHISISIHSRTDEKAVVTIFDVMGKLVFVKNLNVVKGSNTCLVQLPALAASQYILKVTSNKVVESEIFSIQ